MELEIEHVKEPDGPKHRRPKWRPNYRPKGSTPTPVLYGPRKPLREVRRELQAEKATEPQ